jgi:hypothetical protein
MYLLVDDTDGRVLGEFESSGWAMRLLERLHRHDPEAAGRFSIVSFGEHSGSLGGISTSVRLRVLPELPGAPGVPDLR